MLVSWLWVLLIGFLVGAVAKLFVSGGGPHGFLITSLLGIGGALLAHSMGLGIGIYKAGEPAGFLASVLGAILLVTLARGLQRSRVI